MSNETPNDLAATSPALAPAAALPSHGCAQVPRSHPAAKGPDDSVAVSPAMASLASRLDPSPREALNHRTAASGSVTLLLLLLLLLLAGCHAPAGSPPQEASTGTSQAGVAYLSVGYISQRTYPGIGESACAPTSTAMLLRYLFPQSQIDVPEIYHAGLQSYGYSGPGLGYRNLSWAVGYTRDPGSSAIPAGFQSFYSRLGYSGANESALTAYLQNVWNLDTTIVTTQADLYAALKNGPVLGHTYAHGNTKWGHWVVLIQVDTKGTASTSDDVIVLHDPYGSWGHWDTSNGQYRQVPFAEFFKKGRYGAAWFRSAVVVHPRDSAESCANSVVVDTGHNPVSGNAQHHVFQLDDPQAKVGGSSQYAWSLYYGPEGDWYFPNESGHAARWTPKLSTSGSYEVSVRFRADTTSGQVTYTVFDKDGQPLARQTVNQQHAPAVWTTVMIGTVNLMDGAYVRATDIAPGSNIDAVSFRYLGPEQCDACSDYGFAPNQCYEGWQCDAYGQCLTQNGCVDPAAASGGSCEYACKAYGYGAGDCYQGWSCDAAGQCLSNTQCTEAAVCNFACADFNFVAGACEAGWECDNAGRCLSYTGCS